MKSTLPRKFSEHLADLSVLSRGDRVLIALSGGKDSVALASLLNACADRFGISLRACHVNHGIRGEEADRDEAFCEAFCRERSIPFSRCRADVPAFCEKEGMGLEEGARMVRYRLLRQTAKRFDCRFIATAHTADDQAETVLFRLARGTGFSGAAGIPEKSGDLIRPLLPFTGKEIASYLKENNISFIYDSSNEDLSFTRNRIRKKVLPALEKAVPGCGTSLVRFARTASWQDALVKRCADDWEKETGVTPAAGEAPLRDLIPLTETEADYPVLYEIFHRMTGTSGISLTYERFLALISFLKSDFSGKLIEIANGFSFFRDRDLLRFGKATATVEKPEYRILLRTGENALPEIGATLTLSDPKPGKVRNIHKNHLIIHAASDRIEGELFVRNCLPGDRIRMNGLSKSVKKALCDAGYSSEQRKTVPVVCDEGGVFWVPGLGLCDRARDPNASFVLTLDLMYGEK